MAAVLEPELVLVKELVLVAVKVPGLALVPEL